MSIILRSNPSLPASLPSSSVHPNNTIYSADSTRRRNALYPAKAEGVLQMKKDPAFIIRTLILVAC